MNGNSGCSSGNLFLAAADDRKVRSMPFWFLRLVPGLSEPADWWRT